MKRFALFLFTLFIIVLTSSCGTMYQGRWIGVSTLEGEILYCGETHPDGFTLDLHSFREPFVGIAVAYRLKKEDPSLRSVIRHSLRHEGYVGGWSDPESGDYIYDSVRLFDEDDLWEAISFGMKNGQRAIYILSTGEEVHLEVRPGKHRP